MGRVSAASLKVGAKPLSTAEEVPRFRSFPDRMDCVSFSAPLNRGFMIVALKQTDRQPVLVNPALVTTVTAHDQNAGITVVEMVGGKAIIVEGDLATIQAELNNGMRA